VFDPRKLFDTRHLGLSADAMALARGTNASPVGIVSTPAATCEGGAALL